LLPAQHRQTLSHGGSKPHAWCPRFGARSWFGFGAPKDTTAETINNLNKAINTALADPNIKARLSDLGGVPFPGPPTDLGKFIVEEAER